VGLGLWRVRHLLEWLPRDGPELGYVLALRKHLNLLKSREGPKRMPAIQGKPLPGPLPVHVMTGESHWHLTCFCLYSLLEQSEAAVGITVHEDGSLTNDQRGEMVRILPQAQFVSPEQAEQTVDRFLPNQHFPALRRMRETLGLMRKLVDVHAGKTEPTLFIDSDVLFHRNPEFVTSWFRTGQQPVYILDYQDAYGYPSEVLEAVYGRPMPSRVNTGLTGIRSSEIDWDKLEFWASRLLASGGVNHFSEQALTAMLMSDLGGRPAPPEDYNVSPERAEVLHPKAVMHHYVVPSRTWYYTDAIPAFLARVVRRS
jgi:hypothetical protein